MSDPGLPPEIAAAMDQGGAPGAMPSTLESPTGGEEALAQSQIAKDGIAAWERCQGLNGQRCSGDDAKAMILYVLTEGPEAPEAADMSKYLQKIGVKLPGVGATGGDDYGEES